MLGKLKAALQASPLQCAPAGGLCGENEAALQKLASYWQLVKKTNESFNLTALTDDEEAAVKHFWDSLCAARLLPQGARCLDLGSGAGFPGMVLAVMRPDTQWLLLDSLNKRCLFLQQTAEALGLDNVRVLHARAEEGARRPELRESFDIVTARAVTALPVLTELALPYLRCGGCLLALKGPALYAELEAARRALSLLHGETELTQEYSLPFYGDARTLCLIRKQAPTDKRYPRKPGTPQKSPL